MAQDIDAVRRILARWLEDPEGGHPYRLSLERFDEYRAGDREWLEDDVELDFAAGARPVPGLATHGRGRAEFWRLWRGWLEAWSEYAMAYTEWEQRGDAVIVDLEVVASGQLSGAPVSLSATQVWRLHDGRIASLHTYPSRRAAIAALKGAER
jgi:ketosteroid isomerase-like protein